MATPTTHSGDLISSLALLVPESDISAMQDEESTQLGAAFLSSLMEGREVPAIQGIHRAAVLDQK